MLYLYAKAIHIIFVICWMAGLFYMPRLFIYHTEAKDKGAQAYGVLHEQFMVMERRLWWVITTPAMYITVASALTMLYLNPVLLTLGWRSEEHTSELQSRENLVCRLLLE